MNLRIRKFSRLVLVPIGMLMFSGLVIAQFQPTAEQMRIINQLPPAQRQQALSALRQMQSQAEVDRSQANISEPLTKAVAKDSIVDVARRTQPPELEAEPASRVVIDLTPKSSLTANELKQLDEDPVLGQIQGSHFYKLDESGVLHLPGLAGIQLLGLNNDAIMQRLGAEPSLNVFDISAVLLDVQPIGTAALEPFGYDLFESNELGFDPPMAGPVPSDYALGPGDSIRVQLFGNVNGIYELNVSRDGVLNLPELGPITVSGLRFSEFRDDLKNRVEEMLIGTQISVTMGQLRTIRVFVLGDAKRPGSYVVSSLATISSALYRSGGLSEIGSMRNIALKRQGKTVATLDLYDLLLNGDTSTDRRLQSGDVIFVPPIGNTISVSGAVRRPAIYEVKAGATISDVIQLAGGFNSEAYPDAARLERIDNERRRIVLSFNVGSVPGSNKVVKNGDTLVIPTVLPEINDAVVLNGHVHRPGTYQWRPGMRLTDLIPSALDLSPGADADYVLIRRESRTDRSVDVLSADLGAALRDPGGAKDIELRGRDTVHVFSLAFGRQRIIAPILEQLRLQSQFGSVYNEVSINGQIRAPGAYPLEAGMRVSDLIRAGGNMAEGAYALDAELTRFVVVDGEYRTKEIIDVDLEAILSGNQTADLSLVAHDRLRISLVPGWDADWSVTLEGEVKYPGQYQVLRGETLSELLKRAGGLTEYAFPQGAIFLRKSLKEREREQMEILATRMETDLVSLSLETLDSTGANALRTGETLLNQLRNSEPVGRLVIDLELITKQSGDSSVVSNIAIKDGDRLLVPSKSQEVTVIGEVQQPTSHLYLPGSVRNDYIELSGGLTRRADKKLIYVVRASGAVIASGRSKWFGRGKTIEIRAGDTIVVPLETDKIRPLTFWTQVTQILYQGAIAVAAVRTFDN